MVCLSEETLKTSRQNKRVPFQKRLRSVLYTQFQAAVLFCMCSLQCILVFHHIHTITNVFFLKEMTYFEKSNLGNLMKFFMYMVKFSAFPNKGTLKDKKVPS